VLSERLGHARTYEDVPPKKAFCVLRFGPQFLLKSAPGAELEKCGG
jgi:hypothetical protein